MTDRSIWAETPELDDNESELLTWGVERSTLCAALLYALTLVSLALCSWF
jgi:hypothetical protein